MLRPKVSHPTRTHDSGISSLCKYNISVGPNILLRSNMSQLEINLKMNAMHSIAQILWNRPDISDKIKRAVKLTDKKIDHTITLDYLETTNWDVWRPACEKGEPKHLPNYQNWNWKRKIVDSVSYKVASLFLPQEVKADLRRIILSTGVKLFLFYNFEMYNYLDYQLYDLHVRLARKGKEIKRVKNVLKTLDSTFNGKRKHSNQVLNPNKRRKHEKSHFLFQKNAK